MLFVQAALPPRARSAAGDAGRYSRSSAVTLSDETLMAYVDGELDAAARAEVEAAMRRNPELAQRVARQKALRSRVRLAFEKAVEEPVPDRLVSAARAVPATRRESNVIPLRRKPQRRWSWPEWGSIAASLMLGILASQLFVRLSGSSGTLLASQGGRMVAEGALSRALSDQLAADQTAKAPVQIGVSFRSRAGDYCRTFLLRDSSALAGMACRQNDAWHVQSVAQSEKAPEGLYRQAASSAMPKAVLQAVEETISGDPLDSPAEAAAKARGWRH
jgi:hypothetical protein